MLNSYLFSYTVFNVGQFYHRQRGKIQLDILKDSEYIIEKQSGELESLNKMRSKLHLYL